VSELDLQAQTLMKQKEAQAMLDKSISELSEKDRVLSEQIKLKEANLSDLTISIDKQKAELDKQAEALKNQQEMVEKVVKEKNESMSQATADLDKREKEIAKKEEETESKLQKINTVKADIEKRESEITVREFEVENKLKSIELEIQSLTRIEKSNKEILAEIKKANKEQISEVEKVRSENAKSKELLENHETRTLEFQEIYKKANNERTQNEELLSRILTAEEQIKLATTLMRQEFERLIAKNGVDLPFATMISPETQEAVGLALLGNFYRDKTALKTILKRIEWIKIPDWEKEKYEAQINELEARIFELTVRTPVVSVVVDDTFIPELPQIPDETTIVTTDVAKEWAETQTETIVETTNDIWETPEETKLPKLPEETKSGEPQKSKEKTNK